MKPNRIRIAVQKSGRLKARSIEFLHARGVSIRPDNGRAFIVPCDDMPLDILYVRHGDIPQYVQLGAADFGIVGSNVLYENEANVQLLHKLGFGHCKLVIAAPNQSSIASSADLEGERIATSYPNSLRRFLAQRKINLSIVTIHGSVEVAPALGLADAICDLVQTGNTLRENELSPIEELHAFEACLIESPAPDAARDFLRAMLVPQGASE